MPPSQIIINLPFFNVLDIKNKERITFTVQSTKKPQCPQPIFKTKNEGLLYKKSSPYILWGKTK